MAMLWRMNKNVATNHNKIKKKWSNSMRNSFRLTICNRFKNVQKQKKTAQNTIRCFTVLHFCIFFLFFCFVFTRLKLNRRTDFDHSVLFIYLLILFSHFTWKLFVLAFNVLCHRKFSAAKAFFYIQNVHQGKFIYLQNDQVDVFINFFFCFRKYFSSFHDKSSQRELEKKRKQKNYSKVIKKASRMNFELDRRLNLNSIEFWLMNSSSLSNDV